MRISEVTRHPSRQAVNTVLQAAGYTRLGAGLFGAAYEKPGRPYVLKVFTAQDQGYLDFLTLAQAHQDNPHFPRFYKRLVPVTKDYYAIRMEKLTPFDPHQFGEFAYDLFDYIQDGTPTPALEGYPELRAACDLVRTKLLVRYHFDHKDGAFMLRGHTIVITDPVLDTYAQDALRWSPEPPLDRPATDDDDDLLRQLGL
jgi:hypothetical protein